MYKFTVFGLTNLNRFLHDATLIWAEHPEYRAIGTMSIENNKNPDFKEEFDYTNKVDEFFTENGDGMTIGEAIEIVNDYLRKFYEDWKDSNTGWDNWDRSEDYGVGVRKFVLMRF